MRIKGIVVFVIFVWCSLLWAMKGDNLSEWEIVTSDQSYYLKLKADEKKMIEIDGAGQVPTLEKVECHKEQNLCLVVYFVGEIGTQRMVKQWNAAIYNQKTGYFEGDYPFKYEDGDRYFPQPKYQFQKSKLIINDENSGIEKEIFYN